MGWQNKQQECLRISEKKMFYIMVTLPFEFVIVSGPLKPLCGSVATWKKYLYVHFYCGYCPNSSSVNEKYTNLKHYIISSVYKKDPWDFFKATYFVAVVWNVQGQWKAHQLTFFKFAWAGGWTQDLFVTFIYFLSLYHYPTVLLHWHLESDQQQCTRDQFPTESATALWNTVRKSQWVFIF